MLIALFVTALWQGHPPIELALDEAIRRGMTERGRTAASILPAVYLAK